MNQEQQQKAGQHIHLHWGSKACPCCGQVATWTIHPKAVLMANINENRLIDPAAGFACVVVHCNICKYVMHFNALEIGCA